jgi:uncharacterized protein
MEVTMEVTMEVEMRRFLIVEMTGAQLQEAVQLKNADHFRKAYLSSAIAKGLIERMMIVLYGSYATDTFTESSDIDVAVVVGSIEGDFLEREAELYRLRREVDDRIEPVLIEFGNDKSGFLEQILSNGEIVYEKSVGSSKEMSA